MHCRRVLAILVALGSCLPMAADTIEIVRRWSGQFEFFEATGRLLVMPDGSFYGTTRLGGEFGRGSIFHVTPDGQGGFDWTEVYAFSGPDGKELHGGLQRGADGQVYGTALAGGSADAGTIFRLDTAGRLTRLYDFAAGGGRKPTSVLVLGNGSLIGTAAEGGLHDQGTVFRFDPPGTLTTLHDFGGPGEGSGPTAGLVRAADGKYWGTTPSGGDAGFGTVFRTDTSGGFATMHSFAGSQADGYYPSGELAVSGAYVVGTTVTSAVYRVFGTAFRIDTAGVVTTLHVFTTPSGGRVIDGLTLGPDGFCYGLTFGYADPPPPGGLGDGGGNYFPGVMFVVDVNGFFGIQGPYLNSNPNHPAGGIVTASDGFFYGIGSLDFILNPTPGIVRYDTTSAIVAVATMPRGQELFRRAKRLGLTEASDGNVYASTGNELVKIDPHGHETLFQSFQPPPFSMFGLIEASDHDFYAAADARLFRFDAAGNATLLNDGVDGCCPLQLMQASDGNLYGGTWTGGPGGWGTLLQSDLDGQVVTLHGFDGTDGATLAGAPLEASDGNLYGITRTGGDFFGGTLFRIGTDGNGFAVLHHFQDGDGTYSEGTLIEASDGFLYGTTMQGGANGFGSIFRSDLDGNVTNLYDAELYTRLSVRLVERGGFLYGTVEDDNPVPHEGRIFRMDGDGTVATVQTFPDAICSPYSLVQGNDGNLYFTSQIVGYQIPVNAGFLYRLSSVALPPTLEALAPASGPAAGGAALRVTGRHFPENASVAFGGVPAAGVFVDREALLTAVAPPLSPGALYDVSVEASGFPASTVTAAWFADFLDVDRSQIFHDDIEAIFRKGVTAGCGGGNFCPGDAVTRAQMAVFLLKSEHGSSYVPPACTGAFSDVACPSAFADWIEQLAAEGVTAGCGTGVYCPQTAVTRAQMAPFLLKSEHGSGYAPPACSGLFGDVPCPSQFADWIEQLAAEGVTAGCGGGDYCPGVPNTRGQMAAFLTRTFDAGP